MKQQTLDLVKKLKEENQDFEWYPTSKRMVESVFYACKYLDKKNIILDIGCGNGSFFTHYFNIAKQDYIKEKKDDYSNEQFEKIIKSFGEHYQFYGIEKSDILVANMDKKVAIIGSDFHTTNLIDKPADIIFCNPPYSEYSQWMQRIILEADSKNIFFVVPERWKDNESIKLALKDAKKIATIIDTDNFFDGQRQARAKIDIVKVSKSLSSFNGDCDPFNIWFDKTFKMDDAEIKQYKLDDDKKNKINKEIVSSSDKTQMLVDLYNDEMMTTYNYFSTISKIPADVLKDVGVNKQKVKDSLKFKIKNIKLFYWDRVWELSDSINERLTTKRKELMKEKFVNLKNADFSYSNIKNVIIFVLKNAKSFMDEQLVDLYLDWSSPENIKNYKSNKKVFEDDNWGRIKGGGSHYTLSNRIIRARNQWGSYSLECMENHEFYKSVNDFIVIAKNLGFKIDNYDKPKEFGVKNYVYYSDGRQFMEYKCFKNRNTHIKLDMEFAKAFNVEAARLLGWIRNKEDIAKEFEPEMAKGAEKYFKANFNALENSNILMIGV